MAKISAALRSPKKRPISTLVSSSRGIEGGNRGHSLLNGKRVGVSGEGERTRVRDRAVYVVSALSAEFAVRTD